jgi:hypothetical protein
MATDPRETGFDERRRIFRHVEQHAAGVGQRKSVQTRRAAGHGHGHIQAQPL